MDGGLGEDPVSAQWQAWTESFGGNADPLACGA
jgi:hypothetical protein